MPEIKFNNAAVFNKTFDAINESATEQVKIERAIGRVILNRLSGKETDLVTAYREVAGKDPAVLIVMTDMNPEIAKINLKNPSKVAAKAANRGSVAASKQSSVKAGNPVFLAERTALNTLAALGGADFKEKFQIA